MTTLDIQAAPAAEPIVWPVQVITAVAAVTFSALVVLAAHGVNSSNAGIPPADPQLAQFRHFALNGLLAPLMDDAEPPRWTSAALPLICGSGTRIAVNGKPLRDGEPVPALPFTLRWEADGCSPFGESGLSLSGPVTLQVYPQENHLDAVVDARALRVQRSTGVALGAGHFGATLALGPVLPPLVPLAPLVPPATAH